MDESADRAERTRQRRVRRRLEILQRQESEALVAVRAVYQRGQTATIDSIAAELGVQTTRTLRAALNGLVAANLLEATVDDFGTVFYRPTT